MQPDGNWYQDNTRDSASAPLPAGTVNWSYGYNNMGQITSQGVSDPTYEWTPSAASSVPYGTANNRNQYPTVGGATQTHNNNGSLTGDTVWTFGYNAENMLTSAVKTGTNASFVYDPFLRQTQKTVGTTKTKYVYSGSHLMEEYNGATNALLRRYVYAGAEEPIFQIASNGTVTYLHHDHLGSVIAQANASGVVGNKYKYSPWGESPSLTGTTIGYTAQRWDSELSQYNYRARYYRPSTGRFLQADSVGYQQDLNLYTYCVNAPMNHTDPDGMVDEPVPGGHMVHSAMSDAGALSAAMVLNVADKSVKGVDAVQSVIGMKGVIKAGVKAFTIGTYGKLASASGHDGLNIHHFPHHVVQEALAGLKHSQGIAIAISEGLHSSFKTMRKPDFANASKKNVLTQMAGEAIKMQKEGGASIETIKTLYNEVKKIPGLKDKLFNLKAKW